MLWFCKLFKTYFSIFCSYSCWFNFIIHIWELSHTWHEWCVIVNMDGWPALLTIFCDLDWWQMTSLRMIECTSKVKENLFQKFQTTHYIKELICILSINEFFCRNCHRNLNHHRLTMIDWQWISSLKSLPFTMNIVRIMLMPMGMIRVKR